MIDDRDTYHAAYPWRLLADDRGEPIEDEGYRTIVDAKGRPILKEIDGADDWDGILAVDAPVMLRVMARLLDGDPSARPEAEEIIRRHVP